MDFTDQRQLAQLAKERASLVDRFLDECASMFRDFENEPMLAGCDDGPDRWIALEEDVAAAVELVCEKIIDGDFDGLDDDFLVRTYDALCRHTVCLHSNFGSPNHSTVEELREAIEGALPHVADAAFDEVAEWLGFD